MTDKDHSRRRERANIISDFEESLDDANIQLEHSLDTARIKASHVIDVAIAVARNIENYDHVKATLVYDKAVLDAQTVRDALLKGV